MERGKVGAKEERIEGRKEGERKEGRVDGSALRRHKSVEMGKAGSPSRCGG